MAVECSGPYTYSPLQSNQFETRLVTILPGLLDKRLSCTVNHVSLSSKPSYEALSYTWGDHCQCTVALNGRALKITHNLSSALRRLRLPNEPRTLWVDAICINQADLEERSQQVQIMRHIYSKAIRVVIWLGEESEESKEAILDLAAMSKYGFFDTTRVDEGVAVLCSRDSDFNEVEDYLKKHTHVSQSIRDLLNRPWFQRMWVVQELVVAKAVLMLCGSESLDWDRFSRALAVLIHLRTHQDSKLEWGPALKRVVKMDSHRRMKISQRSINGLVHDYRDSLASDPRDKLYSLFGLAKDIGTNVDYTVQTEELYIRMAVFIITQQNSLNLLHAVQGTTDLDLPTWVPDWRMPWETHPTSKDLFRRFATIKEPHSVTGLFGRLATKSRLADRGNAKVRFSTDSRTLSVIGVKWTIINLVTELSSNTIHTLTESDKFWDKLAISDGEKRQACWKHKRGLARSLRSVVLDYGRGTQRGECGSATYGRVLVFLQNGVWGLATRGAEEGDVVCFLHDQGVPFVLRVKQDYYSLVGQYVL
jgi:hypothetical protein